MLTHPFQMGAIQFIENMDRSSLTISDDDFEKNVEAAVSAIAEKHQARSPIAPRQPVFNEKASLHPSDAGTRSSLDGTASGTPRRSTSSNEAEQSDDGAAISGLLRSIQKPLSTIGRIFSDDSASSSSTPANVSRSPAPNSRPVSRHSGDRTAQDGPDHAAARQQHALPAEEAAARQASAEVAEAQRLQRAEHSNVVETLSGMFPDLDKDIISDVVYEKEGR